jgi:hypothetical protein
MCQVAGHWFSRMRWFPGLGRACAPCSEPARPAHELLERAGLAIGSAGNSEAQAAGRRGDNNGRDRSRALPASQQEAHCHPVFIPTICAAGNGSVAHVQSPRSLACSLPISDHLQAVTHASRRSHLAILIRARSLVAFPNNRPPPGGGFARRFRFVSPRRALDQRQTALRISMGFRRRAGADGLAELWPLD